MGILHNVDPNIKGNINPESSTKFVIGREQMLNEANHDCLKKKILQ